VELINNFALLKFTTLANFMIQVINRAIDILEYVSIDKENPKLLGQIAKDLDLNAATCANIVKTLVSRGLLQKSDTQKGYLLGKALYAMGNKGVDYQRIIDAADDEMLHIAKELNENCLLAVMNGDCRKVIHRRHCSQLIQANTLDEKKAYDSSTGRLLLAMLPNHELDSFIKRHGLPSTAIWNDANTKKQFMLQMELIRRNGYALIEDSVQVIGIAAPIYQQTKVVASLSIYLPAFRFTNVMRKEMISIITVSAKKISEKL
jgi:DNA-binding IclR family transcriptional regulator